MQGEGALKEISFQSFEIINVEMVGPIGELKNVEFPMASLKDALTVIRSGHPEGWGIMLELQNNNDHYGFRFNSQGLKKPMSIIVKGHVLPLSYYFSSVGNLIDGRICVVE